VLLRSATAESLRKAFRERIIARYEFPKVVITDNGVQFASRIFKSFLAEKFLAAKLAPRFDGPYQVVDFVSPVICKIRHIHKKKKRTIHIGKLK